VGPAAGGVARRRPGRFFAAFPAIVRVLAHGARRTDGVTQFTLAAHDVMGIRSVAGALRRLATAMGKGSTEALMECQLLFERNDSPRCDFARYPGWAFFDLELLEVGDGGAFTRSDFDAMAKGVAATKRAGQLARR